MVGATSPARALHETAEREQADLIVVSSDTRGNDGRVAADATGRSALHGAPCAVALAPAGFAETGGDLAPVGAGFDGSWESRLALSSAAGVAESVSGELRVISAFNRPAPAHPMFALTSYHEHLARLYDQRWEDLIEAIMLCPCTRRAGRSSSRASRPMYWWTTPVSWGCSWWDPGDMVPCAGCCSAASQMRCWSTPPAR